MQSLAAEKDSASSQVPQAVDSGAGNIKVATSRFGDVEVDRQCVITMINPFLGFPESRRFYLQKHGDNSPFMWLQSLDNPDLAFVVIQPAIINPQYKPDITPHVRTELGITTERELDIMLILTIPQKDPQAMTANLLGPLVINVEKRLGRQVLLDPVKYDPCWPVVH